MSYTALASIDEVGGIASSPAEVPQAEARAVGRPSGPACEG